MPTTISTPFCSDCDLRLVGAAAVDGLHADAALGAGGGEVAGDLHAQLTGGDDDQRLRDAVAALGRRDDALQQRDAEAEGLAGAGAGLADEVVAGQREREGQLLDGEGAGDAGVGQGGDDVGVHVEVAEQRAVRGDGRAAQLLDLRLELLGGRGAGLGVLEGDDVAGDGRWGRSRGVFSVEVSALASGLLGDRLRRRGSAASGLSAVGCRGISSSADAASRPGEGIHPGESPRALDHRPRRGGVQRCQRTDTHSEPKGSPIPMVARAPVSLCAPR